jgi:hypothetical protein
MKHFLLIKRFSVFFLFTLLLSINLNAQKEIVFVYTPATLDAATGENPDIPLMKEFEEAGYIVSPFSTLDLTTATQEQLDSLNNADLVFIGRANGSSSFTSSKELWDAVEAPIMTDNTWALRTSRMNWFAAEDGAALNIDSDIDAVFQANIIETDDPVFKDLGETTTDWWIGHYSELAVTDAGNGVVMATSATDGYVLFVRFEGGAEFYPGAGDTPANERVYFGNSSDNVKDADGNKIYNYYNFSEKVKKVFMNEVGRLTGTFDPEGISDKRVKSNLSVYPNPATDQLNIEMDNLKSVEIMDIAGRLIRSNTSNNKMISLDVSNLNRGIYLVKVKDTNNVSSMKKFTKE